MNPSPSDTILAEWEPALRAFEAAWNGPDRPDLAAFLSAHQNYPIRLLIELAQIDLEFRIRHAEDARVEDYLKRFPALAESYIVLELLENEFQLRVRYANPPILDEYYRRFPHLQDTLVLRFASLQSGIATPTRPHHSSGQPTGRPTIPGYVIHEELGIGGMGVVYRAEQPALNRIVALKTFSTIPSREASARFQREAEAIARLDHPNIVPVYEVGEWDANGYAIPYFVMKWYAGGSLDAVPCGKGTSAACHARTMESVADAVQHAHERGVLHRDLKPSNILLDERGEPCVADFGLAGWYDAENPRPLTEAVVGTPSYMAPEQIREPAKVTTAADVYGIGAIFYQLLTNRPPFQSTSAMVTLNQVLNDSPVSPRMLNPDVPRDLETICLKCLEKSSSHRYRSAAAIAEDLCRWRTGHPIEARTATLLERAFRSALRHPVATALACATTAAILTLLIVLVSANSRIREQERETANALAQVRAANDDLTESLKREQQMLYLERVASANEYWNSNQLPQAWEQLDRCPNHLRQWEWRYLNSMRRFEPITLAGHQEWVQAVAFLPGDRVVSGDILGSMRVWNWKTRKQILARTVVSGHQPISDLIADPNGKWFASVSNLGLIVWDASTYERLQKLDGHLWLAVSADGRYLASGNANTVRIWDTRSWKLVHTLNGHTQLIISGSFHPDGSKLVTCSTDRTVLVWDLPTGKVRDEPLRQSEYVTSVTHLQDGKRLVLTLPSAISVVHPETGEMIKSLENRLSGRVFVAASPDPNVFAMSGSNGEVMVHSLHTGRTRIFRGHTYQVTRFSFSTDGRWLASCGSDNTVRIWDLHQNEEGRPLTSLAEWTGGMSLAPDGSHAALLHSNPTLRQDGVSILNLKTRKSVRFLHGAYDAKYFPDSRRLAACRTDQGVTIWNTENGAELRTWKTPGDLITNLAMSRDGRKLAGATSRGRIFLWDLESGEEIGALQIKANSNTSVTFSPDGNRLMVHGSRSCTLWDVETRSLLMESPNKRGIRSTAFTNDGASILSIDSDRIIRVRDAAILNVIRAFGTSPMQLNSLALHPDGTRLATCGRDGFIRIWDVATGREVLTLECGGAPGHLAWSRDGTMIVAINNSIHSWQVPTRNELQNPH